MGSPLAPFLTLLRELVALPSASCTDPARDQGNLAVAERLGGWLETLGFATEITPLAGHPGKVNLVATRGGGPGGLVLAGHADTVPCDEKLWNSDPWTVAERDGYLYGLGVCDMKGFFPLVLEAVRRFEGRLLRSPLSVVATADEETSMAGARALARTGHLPGRAAVIGEPTDLTPVYTHKGMAMQAVRIRGKSGHSSDPALGRNALEAMHRVLSELLEYRRELADRHRNPEFAVPAPTLNLGRIAGGDNPNRICGWCDLEYDLRALPGMTNDTLRTEIDERLRRVAEEHGVEISHQALFPGIEPFANRPDSELVRLAERLTGRRAGTVAFGTEAPFLQGLGMDTILLGPGNVAYAHGADERLELAKLEPTVEILEGLIAHYCLT